MRFVNSAERYGIKKGIEKGITKGRREQAATTAIRLTVHKFGIVDKTVEMQIKSLSLRKLDRLTIALMGFSSIDDLAAWLQT